MFNPQRYEHVYGVHLLDDIHNYFPEMLYDTEAIYGAQNPLLSYMQTRIHSLFPQDYSHNRTQWLLFRRPQRVQPAPVLPPFQQLPRQPARHVPTQPQRVVQRVVQPARASQPLPQQPTTHATQPQPIATTYTFQTDTHAAGLTSLLAAALFGNTGTATVDIMDLLTPVPVVPTRQQLAAASIVSSVEPSADVTCAICQDHAPPTDANREWRILRHCSHRFHRTCIDQWFRQNVHCPVCRHDIRDTSEDTDTSEDET